MYFCTSSYYNQNGEQVFNILDTTDFDVSPLTETQLIDLYKKVPNLYVYYLSYNAQAGKVKNPAFIKGNNYSKPVQLTNSKKHSGEYMFSVLDGYKALFGELAVAFFEKGDRVNAKKLTGALQVIPRREFHSHPEVIISEISGIPFDIDNGLYCYIRVKGTIAGIEFCKAGFYDAVGDVALKPVMMTTGVLEKIRVKYPNVSLTDL